MFKHSVSSWELIKQLFFRDFFAIYKKSFLGAGWVLVSPIIAVLTWVFMNFTGILHPGDVGIPYPAYVLLSVSIWGLFISFYQGASGTLSAGQGFIFQVKYPHESLLIKQIMEQLANFLITLVVNIIVLLIFHVVPSWKIILFPILILPMLFLGAGLGLFVSVLSVAATETKRIVDLIINNLIFITPVIYSQNVSSGILATIIRLNPLTYLVAAVRDTIIYGQLNNFDMFLWSSLLSLLVFLISLRFFFVSEEKVVERMI